MKATPLFFLVLLMIAGNAIAAKPWSFAGIQMGEPLASSQLPSCPLSDHYNLDWKPPTAICVSSVSDKLDDGLQIAQLGGLTALHWPQLYGGSWASIWNGRVTNVRIYVGQVAFADIKQILTTRYGKPSSSEEEEVTSNGGATVESSEITWRESGNTIKLTERCEHIDRSCVDVYNDATMQARMDAKKHSAAAAASIL